MSECQLVFIAIMWLSMLVWHVGMRIVEAIEKVTALLTQMNEEKHGRK